MSHQQEPETSQGDGRGTNEQEPLLSVNDVKVHFEKENQSIFGEPETVKAVDGISFDLTERDVLVLVGESGCGKTTLGKTAVGLQRPTDGTVNYRGQDVWTAKDRLGDIDIPFREIRQSLQIIHQDPGSSLNSHKRVRSILEEPLIQGSEDLDWNQRRARILGMLEHVGMEPAEDYIDRYPHQLSGGEQQRIALVRAFLMNPDVILGDEAISALDVSLRIEMMDLMMDLQEMFDTAFLFISHNLSNARYIAGKTGGRIGVMYLGELVEIGTVDKIINDPDHPYTRALKWATPELDPEDAEEKDEMPIRSIDIPDPEDPPSGCPYHTRCPEAREVCATEQPSLLETDAAEHRHQVACFRSQDDHDYWDSDPIE
jgi:peptide/nickel transport system ATP-binding protein